MDVASGPPIPLGLQAQQRVLHVAGSKRPGWARDDDIEWLSEETEARNLVERHPDYDFLVLVAGAGNMTVEALFDSDSVSAAARRAIAQHRRRFRVDQTKQHANADKQRIEEIECQLVALNKQIDEQRERVRLLYNLYHWRWTLVPLATEYTEHIGNGEGFARMMQSNIPGFEKHAALWNEMWPNFQHDYNKMMIAICGNDPRRYSLWQGGKRGFERGAPIKPVHTLFGEDEGVDIDASAVTEENKQTVLQRLQRLRTDLWRFFERDNIDRAIPGDGPSGYRFDEDPSHHARLAAILDKIIDHPDAYVNDVLDGNVENPIEYIRTHITSLIEGDIEQSRFAIEILSYLVTRYIEKEQWDRATTQYNILLPTLGPIFIRLLSQDDVPVEQDRIWTDENRTTKALVGALANLSGELDDNIEQNTDDGKEEDDADDAKEALERYIKEQRENLDESLQERRDRREEMRVLQDKMERDVPPVGVQRALLEPQYSGIIRLAPTLVSALASAHRTLIDTLPHNYDGVRIETLQRSPEVAPHFAEFVARQMQRNRDGNPLSYTLDRTRRSALYDQADLLRHMAQYGVSGRGCEQRIVRMRHRQQAEVRGGVLGAAMRQGLRMGR